MEERIVYLIIGSSGAWEDYSDWVHECYLDKDIATKVKDDMNRELEKKQNNPKYIKAEHAFYNDIETSDVDTRLQVEWLEIKDQHQYIITDSVIKDFYYTTRNESIDDIIN